MSGTANGHPPMVVTVSDTRPMHRWITDLSRHAGVVGVSKLPAGHPTLASAASDLLEAMGKEPELTVMKRSAEVTAAAWLRAGGFDTVVVSHVEAFGVTLQRDLMMWLTGLGMRTVFVFADNGDGTARRQAEQLAADWSIPVGNEADLKARFTATPPKERTKKAPEGLPALPRCDGLVFRSACRDHLAPATFARVDKLFVAEVRRLLDLGKVALRSPERIKARPLGHMLAAEVTNTSSTEELVLRVRAAQVAMLRLGWLLKVDTVQLVVAAETVPRVGVSIVGRWWEHLDRYRDPDIGAAVALHHADLTAADIAAVTLGDITDTGRAVTVAGADVEFGARFVRVLVEARQLSGATSADALFATHRADQTRQKYIGALLASPCGELGINMQRWNPRLFRSAKLEQLAEYGITLTGLKTAGDDAA